MWNYRVIRKVTEGVDTYGIHEVYYTDEGIGRYCTENPCSPFGTSKGDLAIDIGLMIRSLGEEVLNYTDFNQEIEEEVDPNCVYDCEETWSE